jgi:hypothetical protein
MRNPDYEFLIALHELVEQALQIKRKIPEESITKFDTEFTEDGDPGDSPESPYFQEHQFATKIEYMMLKELGLDESEYNKFLDKFIAENSRTNHS